MKRYSESTNINTLIAKFKHWVRSRKVTSSDIDSTGATSGQVPTADGSGGTLWQTPSGGGGSGVYKHFIEIEAESEGLPTGGTILLVLITQSSASFTSKTEIINNIEKLIYGAYDEYIVSFAEPSLDEDLLLSVTNPDVPAYPITIIDFTDTVTQLS